MCRFCAAGHIIASHNHLRIKGLRFQTMENDFRRFESVSAHQKTSLTGFVFYFYFTTPYDDYEAMDISGYSDAQ